MSARDVVEALAARGLTVATAESLTGGLIVGSLTAVPGASAVVRGGVVAYATDVKVLTLGVDAALVAQVGAVDPDVAEQMALPGVGGRSTDRQWEVLDLLQGRRK